MFFRMFSTSSEPECILYQVSFSPWASISEVEWLCMIPLRHTLKHILKHFGQIQAAHVSTHHAVQQCLADSIQTCLRPARLLVGSFLVNVFNVQSAASRHLDVAGLSAFSRT